MYCQFIITITITLTITTIIIILIILIRIVIIDVFGTCCQGSWPIMPASGDQW